ncbi:tRNA guanosine(34) transglycosylase Tgt [Hippea alviniae]|uniref:tRNA guanosine(34) transglycosylase Tgt n=1 Tax=Hippea alviniae TaxID=1279027 RepID=UPI0003B3B8AF|nr:tRNA guanosine(34) transglycosylase Tgt [Hippea alviniae]
MSFSFKLIAEDGSARAGVIDLGNVKIETPVFMPVGTNATVKAILPCMLKAVGATIILSNTYHLYLRPGIETIEKLGGLHKFMGWKRGILTDSGGFQVFSLSDLRSINPEGVSFKSHIDGSMHFFTPEYVVELQSRWGSDIAMVLDECPPYTQDKGYVKKSLEITINWAERSLKARRSYPIKALFGIVQGGVFDDLRREAALRMRDMEFEGFAIGGLSVGEPIEDMYRVVPIVNDILPKSKPRYAMGIGRPENIIELIGMGVDMFDCVMPTRNARNGTLFTRFGVVNIKRQEYRDDDRPIEEGCRCYTCRNFSRGYLRHLHKAKELSFYTLASIHNLYYYIHLVKSARNAILEGKFEQFKREFYLMQKEGEQ